MTDEERRERQRGYCRKYYWAHREEILARHSQYTKKNYRENRDLSIAQSRAYYQAHKEEIKERRKAYYTAHREQILSRSKEEYRRFREESPELAKKIYCDYARRAYLKRKEKKYAAEEQPG